MPRPGTPFEEWVQAELGLRPTANSGAKFSDADARHRSRSFVLECKDEAGEAIRFPYTHLLKIKRQALLYGRGHWVRAFRNGKGDVVVSMDFALFKQMLAICDEAGW